MVARTAILIVNAVGEASEEIGPLVTLLHHTLPAFFLTQQQSISSQRYWIEETLRRWCDEEETDLIVTVGGTFPAVGLGDAEIVPEATSAVLERMIPSLPETMRAVALEETPTAILDRGVAGIRGRTLILNLPGGADLALLFLQSVVDLLPLFLERMQPQDSASAIPPVNPASGPRQLDQSEFAEFLRARRQRG